MKKHAPIFLPSLIASSLAFSCSACTAQKLPVSRAPIYGAQAPVSDDHLVAHYTFAEPSTGDVQDATGKNNKGAIVGNVQPGKGPTGNGAIGLPGSSNAFVAIPKAVIDTTKSFTVTACVQLKTLSGFQTFVSIDGNTNSAFYLQLRGDSNAFGMTMMTADERNGNNPAVAVMDDAPETNVWYHLTGVYDASTHKVLFYRNGIVEATANLEHPAQGTGDTILGRGKFGGNPVDAVNGQIADVRIYDTALSPEQIRTIADSDLPVAVRPKPQPILPASLTVDFSGPSVAVSPLFYGLMTEEINYSYEGGLYGELVRNRVFKDDSNRPVHWSPIAATITLDKNQPIAGTALTTCLKVEIPSGGNGGGVANDGFWGIPVTPKTKYTASFYAKSSENHYGPLDITIQSNDGKTVLGHAKVRKITNKWTKYTVKFFSSNQPESLNNQLVISGTKPGTLWLNQVSLFAPTFKNRPNGSRKDLMEKMATMKPTFLRLPGGNYLEGNTIAERFDWKATIGDISERPGHYSPWGYRSTDGMGLLEFLYWCEDLKVEPVLAVFAGYALNGEYVPAGPKLTPFVQDALDEVEYLTGSVDTKWGAIRAKNGHPKPFPLTYVEIGNEDWFDKSGSYDGRFAQFYDAFKKQYPKLQLIATMPVKTRKPDVLDDHFYKSPRAFERDVAHYDNYDRTGPKIFVGEWASQEGRPTPDMNSALGDAAFLIGAERNSDVVIMEAYAPLFVNVNPGGSQWGTNLIGYDALHSYGSPSFYVQQMFGQNHGDRTVAVTLTGGGRITSGVTRDTKKGIVYIRLVNASAVQQSLQIDLKGTKSISSSGTAIVLKGDKPTSTNTIQDPTAIIPVSAKISGVGRTFKYTLPAYSITVLKLGAK